MSTGHSNTLSTAGVHVYKYNVTNAHRILRMMLNDATPYATRRAIRTNLQRLAACTDINPRDAFKVEHVAVMLRVAIQHQPSALWRRAKRAHDAMWAAFNAHDRVINPRRWKFFDEVMSAYRERLARASRAPARRAARPRAATRPASAVRAAA